MRDNPNIMYPTYQNKRRLNFTTIEIPTELITVKHEVVNHPCHCVKHHEDRSIPAKCFTDYSANTSLHGMKYIGDPDRVCSERLCWIATVSSSISICAILIIGLWGKWNDTPVTITFSESFIPVYEIPFPGVTICPEIKTRRMIFNFSKNLELYINEETRNNMTDNEKEMLEDLSLICNREIKLTNGKNTTDTIIDSIIEVAPIQVIWTNHKIITLQNLQPMLTDEGLCYTFNALNTDEVYRTENIDIHEELIRTKWPTTGWDLDEGYPEGAPFHTYPLRLAGYGNKHSVNLFFLASEKDIDHACNGPVEGFKLMLHSPVEEPQTARGYLRVQNRRQVNIAIRPDIMTTEKELRRYSPERRQCFFYGEYQLKFFKFYTQANCELEWLTNYTLTRCHCVQFFMPRNSSTPICASAKTNCIKSITEDLIVRNLEAGAEPAVCLPTCNYIHYNAELSQGNINTERLNTKPTLDGDSDLDISSVKIFFKEPNVIPLKRSELYGDTDFLANCGGLLGLCTGFSLLSMAEIFYFLILRMCYKLTEHAVKTIKTRKGRSKILFLN